MRRILMCKMMFRSHGGVSVPDFLHPGVVAPVPVPVDRLPDFLSPPSNCVPGSRVETHLTMCFHLKDYIFLPVHTGTGIDFELRETRAEGLEKTKTKTQTKQAMARYVSRYDCS